MKTKTFDCVAMKRQGSLHIYELTKDLTLEQKIEFWRRRSEQLRKEQDQRVAGEKNRSNE